MNTRKTPSRPGTWPLLSLVIALLVVVFAVPAEAENLVKAFTGSGPDTTPRFEVEGPWRVDWEAGSEHPLLSAFYTNLYDAKTSEYLGFITQLRGTGAGSKLIRESGEFRIGISGNDVDWTIRIVELSKDEAEALEAAAAGRPRGAELPPPARPAPSTLVASGSFIGWNVVDERTLHLVTGEDGLVLEVTLAEPCRGLTETGEVLFVTPDSGATNVYNSILLDDGTRCYFERVVPQYR
ncbi:hypothetical protein [Lentisalinibacter sediminis]|uniref:hypothetical protein n=1 Tax=Lentisalinibacter sediminis TaxID=2992237 RepID=UPI00386F338C